MCALVTGVQTCALPIYKAAWLAYAVSRSLTPAERQALQREWATAKQRRAEERVRSEAEAAKDAAEMWAAAGPARADHAYLVKKGISPHRFRQSADKVLVPMFAGEDRKSTRLNSSH